MKPLTPAVLSPAARRDLLDNIRWIARDNPAASRALRNAVAATATTIGEHPYAGTLRPEVIGAPYRFMSLATFPYVLIYDAERRPPVVARILHTARNLPVLLRTLGPADP